MFTIKPSESCQEPVRTKSEVTEASSRDVTTLKQADFASEVEEIPVPSAPASTAQIVPPSADVPDTVNREKQPKGKGLFIRLYLCTN